MSFAMRALALGVLVAIAAAGDAAGAPKKKRKGAAARAKVTEVAPRAAAAAAAGTAGAAAVAAPEVPAPAAPGAPPAPEIPADAPTAAARLDRTEARIGDRITLTVTTVAGAGVPTNLPTELDLGPFERLGGGEPVIEEKDLGEGKRSRAFRLDIAAYDTGELELPSIPVTYIGKDGRVLSRPTEPVKIKITSLLANEPDPQLKDPVGPVSVLEQDLTLVYVGAGLAIAGLAALVTLWLRRRWRARDQRRPAPPPRPAHEIALEKLGQLAKGGLGDGQSLEEVRAFYFQLSEIVREYLGSRFGFLALEMTTEELVDELSRRAPRGIVPGEIAGWLSGCDLVKFAKWAPPPSEARGALETAIRMVEATRPRPEPTPGVGTPPPGARPQGGAAHGA